MAPFLVSGSERQFILWDDLRIIGRLLVLRSILVLEMHSVDGHDDSAHFVDQFEDGEGLFRRPVCRDAEGYGERQGGIVAR